MVAQHRRRTIESAAPGAFDAPPGERVADQGEARTGVAHERRLRRLLLGERMTPPVTGEMHDRRQIHHQHARERRDQFAARLAGLEEPVAAARAVLTGGAEPAGLDELAVAPATVEAGVVAVVATLVGVYDAVAAELAGAALRTLATSPSDEASGSASPSPPVATPSVAVLSTVATSLASMLGGACSTMGVARKNPAAGVSTGGAAREQAHATTIVSVETGRTQALTHAAAGGVTASPAGCDPSGTHR